MTWFQPLRPVCCIDAPDRSSSSVSRAVEDAWDVYGDELAVVSPDVVLALKTSVDDFWSIWSKSGRPVFLGRTVGPPVPLQLAAPPSWEEAC